MLKTLKDCSIVGRMGLVLWWSVFLQGEARATTWHVPGDTGTIQQAIDAASPGDDVLVAEGIYRERAIVLKAEVWVHSEAGAVATIIDAEQQDRVMSFTNLGTARVEGFTLRNGSAEDFGGGLLCRNGTISLVDCIVEDCRAGEFGGGVYGMSADIRLVSCAIRSCRAETHGAGIFVWSTRLTAEDCRIEANTSAGGAGGIAALGAQTDLSRCWISENLAQWGDGGGVLIAGGGFCRMTRCLFDGNSARTVGGGGAVAVHECAAVCDGCTIVGNNGDAGAVLQAFYATVEIERCIVAFNSTGGMDCFASTVNVGCSDVYGNGGAGGDEICGGDMGGNFRQDPLFCNRYDDVYTLREGSPCAPGNHPDGVECDLIGALGVSCDEPIAIERSTWGRLRRLFR